MLCSIVWLSLLVVPVALAVAHLNGDELAFATVLMVVLATRSTKCELLQMMDGIPDDDSRFNLQRYVHVLSAHFDNGWNWLDIGNLVIMWLVIVRHRSCADIGLTAQFMAAGTSLLWLRVVNYLNGFEVTASYVRMTFAIMSDMRSFMLILAIIVVGNAFVLLFLYPEDVLSRYGNDTDSELGWELDGDEAATVEHRFGGYSRALFTSMIMFFDVTELQLVQDAYSPSVATWHYLYYVVLLPLILLNLLIALMGGESQLHVDSSSIVLASVFTQEELMHAKQCWCSCRVVRPHRQECCQ